MVSRHLTEYRGKNKLPIMVAAHLLRIGQFSGLAGSSSPSQSTRFGSLTLFADFDFFRGSPASTSLVLPT
jgi:hypothetical protein